MWLRVGSKSSPLENNIGDSTHKWSCYVKFLDEKNEATVDKVIFKLHESFSTSLRSIINPPFEVNESGWGEFEIQIRIIFKDQSLKPVALFHMLKLYSDSETTQEVVVSERMERLIIDANSHDRQPPISIEELESNEYTRIENTLKVSGLNLLG